LQTSAPVSQPHRKPLKVLAWPASRKRAENPYTYLVQLNTAPYGVETYELTALQLLRPGWDIIHIHWPEMLLTKPGLLRQIVTGATLLLLLFLQRLFTRTRLVWTVHNAEAHEVHYPRWGRFYMKLFIRMVDGIIILTEASRTEVIARYPRLEAVPYILARQGHYRHLDKGRLDPSLARAAHGLADNDFVFLYFGQIRPYKNVPRLVSCFRQLQGDHFRLIVAGAPIDQHLSGEIATVAQADPRITLDMTFIPEERLVEYLWAADCVVLPFSQVLNSGSALLALSFERPVLTINTPTFSELGNLVGKGWISTYDGDLTANTLADAATAQAPSGSPDLSEFEWNSIGRSTAEFFHRLVTPSGDHNA
jgi:glycosyltransferase involved in cell wall biosynthesis